MQQLHNSLAITTFQPDKVLFVSTQNAESLNQLPCTSFRKAMGLALKDNRMAAATKSEIIVLENSLHLTRGCLKRLLEALICEILKT